MNKQNTKKTRKNVHKFKDEGGNLQRLSSTNQPKNRGRKKSILNQTIIAGQLSREDAYKAISYMLNMPVNELSLIANNKEKPIYIITIARALLNDLSYKRTSTVDNVFNRLFGLPRETVFTVEKREDEMSIDEIDEEISKLNE